MSGPSDSSEEFVELVKIASSIEADLLAVYLDQAGLEFRMLDKTSAPVLASMLPKAHRPVTFVVRLKDLVQARKFVTEYKELQSAELLPSDPPPSPEND
jgi:hypothetical protein